MNIIKHCRQGAGLLTLAMAAAFLSVPVHAEDEWIYLTGNDSSGNATAFNSASTWSSGEGPEAGKNYRTTASYTMYTPGVSANLVFTGACLKIEKQLWHTTPASGSATISNMIGVAGAEIYTSGGKGPLRGTLTLESTLANPFSWRDGFGKGTATQKLYMDIVGNDGTRFTFKNGNTANLKTFYYDGELSRFSGTLDALTANTLVRISGAATNFPGTLKSAGGAQLNVTVAAGTTNRIGKVDTTDLTVELNEGSVLHIVSGFETHGVPVKVVCYPASATNADEYVLMTFGADVAESFSETDFDISWNTASSLPGGLNQRLDLVDRKVQIRTAENGVRSLVVSHNEIVYQKADDKSDGSKSVFLDGTNWDHVPADPSSTDYYIVQKDAYFPTGGTSIEFPGASLTLGGVAADKYGRLMLNRSGELNVADFRWAAVNNSGDIRYFHVWPDPSFTIGGGTITVVRAENATFGIQIWNDRLLKIDSVLRGSGELLLTAEEKASKNASGTYQFTADNSAFTGRMRVMHNEFTGATPSANPHKYFITVRVADQTNLGGPLPAFDAESLSLEDDSLLSVTQSAVFDEPTRGWSIKGHGRITVPQDATVVVTNKTITYEYDGADPGCFTKEGAGTLVLGGTADAKPGEAGVTNVLEVKEGALRFASTTAAAGLTVCVKSGATLSLDLSATGEFKEKGVVNAAETPFSVEGGGAIPVALMASAEFPEEAFEVAICTVPDTLAGTLAFSVPARFAKRSASVVTHDNGDGTVTFAVRLAEMTGLRVIIR